MSNPTTYSQAMAAPSRAIWPGCDDGRCMPCGRIHDFSRLGHGGRRNHGFRCARNHYQGCPTLIPEPEHDWDSGTRDGRCRKCGVRPRWRSPDGASHRSVFDARNAGWNREQLTREDRL